MPRMTRDEIVAKLEAAIAEGVIWNVDYKDISSEANRALYDEYKTLERMALDGGSNAEYALIYASPSVLNAPGYVKRASKYPRFAERVAMMSKWVKVAELLKAAKPLIKKGRQPNPNSEADKEAAFATAKTCQICGRPIQEVNGKIAHHGYERPGTGQQTDSCIGARELPYERSRDLIPGVVASIDRQLAGIAVAVAEYKAGTRPAPREISKRGPSGRTVEYVITNSHDLYACRELALKTDDNAYAQPGEPDYARRAELSIANLENEHRHVRSFRDQLQKRYDTWFLGKSWRDK